MTSSAATITKAASKQTYYTIRYLVDPARREDAYRAYAYFRWIDDTLDAETSTKPERTALLKRQQDLLNHCLRGEAPQQTNTYENMLVELVRHNQEKQSGLHTYLHNMMAVMDFDVRRRGKLIAQAELDEYTHWLACGVTEAMHYFIGHDAPSPHDGTRYLAVTAAHITHMLRDTYDDVRAGYYNIPSEVLETNHIGPQDIQSAAYRTWVKGRVQLARDYFQAGREYLARVQSWRCRLAGLAYTARFDWLLDTVEREDYCLRPHYDERKRAGTAVQMGWHVLLSMLSGRRATPPLHPIASKP